MVPAKQIQVDQIVLGLVTHDSCKPADASKGAQHIFLPNSPLREKLLRKFGKEVRTFLELPDFQLRLYETYEQLGILGA